MLAKAYLKEQDSDYIISIRREIHRHPELGFELPNTVRVIRRELDAMGIQTILRLPVIPGWNDREEHLKNARKIADSLRHCIGVEIMPYHAMGSYKYGQLGQGYKCADVEEPNEETIQHWRNLIQ